MNLQLLFLPHTELATAIPLIIEIVFLNNSYTAFAQSTLAPVLFPPDDIGIVRCGKMSSVVDLLQALPTAGGKRSGDDLDASLVSITGRIEQAHLEASQASASPLRLILHPLDMA